MTELHQDSNECAGEEPQLRSCQVANNIGSTVGPLFRRLKDAWDFQTEAEQNRRKTPSTIIMTPDNIADDSTFHYFMLNIFKAGSMSHVSVRPGLAVPLSLMLVLKYSRGIQQIANRKKALLVSLSHPIEIAESLMSHCLGRSVRPLLHGEMVEKDWPWLTRAAGTIHDLGIDFLIEGASFVTKNLKGVIESSSWPYGLVVINDSIGELEQNDYVSVQHYKKIRSLTTELNLPVIIINSHLQQVAFDADIFDHVAQLRDELNRYQLFINRSDRKAFGKLSFVMSQTCNILEDSPTTPANCEIGSE